MKLTLALLTLTVFALIPAAVAQVPARADFADRVATIDVSDAMAIDRLAPLPPRSPRQNPAPLFQIPKERPGPVDALTPELSALLAPPATADATLQAAPVTPQMLSGFAGPFEDSGITPPDTTGAVSPNFVVTTLNSDLVFQSRDGRVLGRVSLDRFIAPLGPFSTFGTDPRIAWDAASERWFFVCAADVQRPETSSVVVAVSNSADPTGAWTLYRLRLPDGEQLSIDYPSMALTGDWLVIATNLFRASRFERTQIFVMTRQDLVAGRGAFRTFHDDQFSLVPAYEPGAPSRVLLVTIVGGNIGGNGVLRISEISGAPGAEQYFANRGTVRIESPWMYNAGTSLAGVLEQLGSSQLIDAGDSRMQNCVVRRTSLWCTHTAFLPVGTPRRAVVQWERIDIASGFSLTAFGRIENLQNEADYAFPSIAVNRNDDVLLGFTRFSLREYPTAVYALRVATEASGQFQPEAIVKHGEAPYFNNRGGENRWGDYSHTVVDPVDDLRFWTVQEYAASTMIGGPRWGTWWAAVTPQPAGTPPCNFQLTATSLSVPAEGGSRTLAVNTAASCQWMAASNVAWASIAGSPATGIGTVVVTFPRSTSAAARIGTLTVAGQAVEVRQDAGVSLPFITITSLTAPTSGVVGQPIAVRAAIRNDGAVAASRFRLGFYFSLTPAVTTGTFDSGYGCEFATGLAAGATSACAGDIPTPSALSPGTYYVIAIADDRSATTLSAQTGGTVLAAAPTAPSISAAGIAHAATTRATAVSPGLLLVLYGLRMGPDALTGLQLNSQGRVATSLAGTRVLFDGVAAPMIYTSTGQISAVTPYSVAGKATVNVQAEYLGIKSAAINVPVVPAAPGYFSLNLTGAGPGAFLNQDGTVNSSTNPARRGSVVTLYATGGGQLAPAGIDGAVIAAPLPVLAAGSASVTIGGVEAHVLYVGPAPGLVSGVLQINVEVPSGVTPGTSVPVTLRLGNASSPAGVTLAVE